MEQSEIQRILGSAVPVVLEELRDYGFEGHCIEASSLLMKVLHGLGLTNSYRLTVGVRLINEALRLYVAEHGMPHDEATGKACDDAGGATVILGRDAPEVPEGTWKGHLTVIVPNAFGPKHALLDPTITQANWPEYGIEVPPLCLKVTDDFLSGEREAKFDICETLLIYSAYPDDVTYEARGDCMQNEGFDEAVRAALDRIRV